MAHRLLEDEGGVIAQYFRDIARHKSLSRQEEIMLARRVQQGDKDARDQLVRANLRFVVWIAREYQGNGIFELIDLISLGNIGLINAVERYEPDRGVKFISFAVWWIRQAIMYALKEHAHIIRLPINRLEQLRQMGRLLRRVNGESIEGDLEQIVDLFNKERGTKLKPDEVAEMLACSRPWVSLDGPVENQRGEIATPLLELLSDSEGEPTEARVEAREQGDEINAALARLTLRERQVIENYFGLNGNQVLTLEEIGEQYQVTRERARQIKEKALQKLRGCQRLRAFAPQGEVQTDVVSSVPSDSMVYSITDLSPEAGAWAYCKVVASKGWQEVVESGLALNVAKFCSAARICGGVRDFYEEHGISPLRSFQFFEFTESYLLVIEQWSPYYDRAGLTIDRARKIMTGLIHRLKHRRLQTEEEFLDFFKNWQPQKGGRR